MQLPQMRPLDFVTFTYKCKCKKLYSHNFRSVFTRNNTTKTFTFNYQKIYSTWIWFTYQFTYYIDKRQTHSLKITTYITQHMSVISYYFCRCASQRVNFFQYSCFCAIKVINVNDTRTKLYPNDESTKLKSIEINR